MQETIEKTKNQAVKEVADQDYKYGFVTNVQSDIVPEGLNEDIITLISQKKRRTLFYARMETQCLP